MKTTAVLLHEAVGGNPLRRIEGGGRILTKSIVFHTLLTKLLKKWLRNCGGIVPPPFNHFPNILPQKCKKDAFGQRPQWCAGSVGGDKCDQGRNNFVLTLLHERPQKVSYRRILYFMWALFQRCNILHTGHQSVCEWVILKVHSRRFKIKIVDQPGFINGIRTFSCTYLRPSTNTSHKYIMGV